jgi:arsenate reductase
VRRDRDRILFLDRTNSSRSQIAEALLRGYAGDALDACSAGLEPQPIPVPTCIVLGEVGIDPGGLYPKNLRTFLSKVPVRWAIILRELTEAAAPRIYPFARETLCWPCPDPEKTADSGKEQLAAFRAVRDHLQLRIRAWLDARGFEAFGTSEPRASTSLLGSVWRSA